MSNLTLSQTQPTPRTESGSRSWRLGTGLSLTLIVTASGVGGTIFPLSHLGRTAPLSVSKEWITLLVISWALLAALALGFAWLLRRRLGLPMARSLFWAALCHIPLLLCLALVDALYSGDLPNHVYTRTPYGELIFQPMAQAYVLLAPIAAQAAVLAAYRRQFIERAIPLIGILVVALGLRIWNVNWALPAVYHPDEFLYLSPAMTMLSTGDLNPHYFQNPSLLIYLVYLLDRVLLQWAQGFHVVNDFLGWGILDPRWDFLVDVAARGISVLAGTLTVLIVYWTGRELWDRRAGLVAASLLAVCFLHVRDSHYMTNDVLATFFLSASLLFSVRVHQRGNLRDYLLAGLCGGLGTASKYNVGFFFLALLVAHLIRTRSSRRRLVSLTGLAPLAAAGLISLVGFAMGTPYALLDFPSFLDGFHSQLSLGANPWPGQDNTPSALLYLAALVQGFGLLPLTLAFLGAILLAQHHRKSAVLLLSVPVVYLLFMSTVRLAFVRFAIPVLPFLALLAGYAIRHPWGLRGGPLKAWTSTLLLAAALIQPLVQSWHHDYLIGQTDTRTLAAAWIDDHVLPGERVAAERIGRIMNPYGWTGQRIRDISSFNPVQPRDEQEVFDGSGGYVIVTSFAYDMATAAGWTRSIYDRLDAEGQLVAVISPGKGQRDVPFSVEDDATPFWHLWDWERPGPTVKIYKLQRAPLP